MGRKTGRFGRGVEPETNRSAISGPLFDTRITHSSFSLSEPTDGYYALRPATVSCAEFGETEASDTCGMDMESAALLGHSSSAH